MKNLLLTFSSLLVACATAFSANAQEVKGNAKDGEGKVAMCIGCHGIQGYQASFPEIYRVPMISGQNAKFIVSALNAYKKGERRHPSMRAISESLSDQDIADVAAFYETNGKAPTGTPRAPAPSALVADLLNKGGCIACHGDNFNKPIDPSYPKIGGQPADYLFVALKSYKVEGRATWGRANGIMGGVAKQLSHAEMKELAGYISSLPTELRTVPQSKFR